MDWIYAHPDFAVAVISPILVAIGYFYRARTEKHDNLREALYLLLEIWRRMSIVSKGSVENVFDTITTRIRAQFPGQPISEDAIKAAKAYFTPILSRALKAKALEDFDGLQDAYAKVVKLISKSDPVYAHLRGEGFDNRARAKLAGFGAPGKHSHVSHRSLPNPAPKQAAKEHRYTGTRPAYKRRSHASDR